MRKVKAIYYVQDIQERLGNKYASGLVLELEDGSMVISYTDSCLQQFAEVDVTLEMLEEQRLSAKEKS